MDLNDYLRILRRHWIQILSVSLIGLVVGGGLALITRPTYTAETQLFVAIQNSGSVAELQQGNTFTQARVLSYVKAATTPIVLQPVIDSLGLQASAAQLAQDVSVSNDPNTVIISIGVRDGSAVQAAAIAKAIGTSLITVVDQLEKPSSGGVSPVKLSVVTPAVAPSSPSAPNTKIFIIVGLLGGLIVGVAIALARTTFDDRIRGEGDLKHITDAPILGGIAFDNTAAERPLLTDSHQQGPRAESFRTLRTNLQFANVSAHAKTVMVTSSLPGEGKSTTATNLAIALGQSGQRVCLVDADLRRPMVAEYLGLERDAGLTTALVGSADLDDLVQHWGPDELYVLTSGQIPPNPSELLGSDSMRQLIHRLENSYDAVIIDAPPLLPVTDAAVLSQHVGGTILVVSAQQTKRPELERALTALDIVGAPLSGLVMNRLPVKGPDSYSYSYYSYSSHDTSGPTSRSKKPRSRKGSRKAITNASITSGNRAKVANSDLYFEGSYVAPLSAKKFPRSLFDDDQDPTIGKYHEQ